MMLIPKPLIILGLVLLLGSWFLLVERQSFWEKIGIIIGVIGLYFGFRLMTGSSLDEIMNPILTWIYS